MKGVVTSFELVHVSDASAINQDWATTSWLVTMSLFNSGHVCLLVPIDADTPNEAGEKSSSGINGKASADSLEVLRMTRTGCWAALTRIEPCNPTC
jgi:hypothetical protein